jgi:predicted AlkP superfamily pyrophosphatase or phosphodiesterase
MHLRAWVALLAVGVSLPAAAERPKLGVLIVVDQLNSAFIEKHLASLPGGFKRLAKDGFRFHEARYETAPTITSEGHATLVTCTYPDVHGIVGNTWFDQKLGRGTQSTEDPRYQTLLRAPEKNDCTAPTFLRAPSLGDALKVQDPRSKVVAVTGKDRAAIISGGASADLAIWFDNDHPFFTSSTYYAKDLPPWAMKVNTSIGEAIVKSGLELALPGGGITGQSPALEKKKKHAEMLTENPVIFPAIDHGTVDMAVAAVEGMELGLDDAPDLLVVSFSTFDFLAHAVGHDSGELEKNLRNVDAELLRLFDALDKKPGKGKWTAALTADHGGMEVPETLAARRIDAGRVDDKAILNKLEETADQALGAGDYFEGYWKPGYTARAAMREKLSTINDKLREAAKSFEGVMDLVPARELVEHPEYGPVHKYFRRGIYKGRSADYILILRPNWLYGTRDKAGHASAWLYDRSVPLFFYGAGVKKGSADRAEAIDVAPTLARILGVQPPEACEGRVLSEALLP